MKMKYNKILMVFTVVFLWTGQLFASPIPQDIEPTTDWKLYSLQNGVRIEYKFVTCEFEKVKNQVLVVFRYTNNGVNKIEMSWKTKVFRNNECENCSRMDNPEYAHVIQLESGESLEGDGTSKENKDVYLFSHFIKLVPGMSVQKLTDFEFVNVSVTSI